ncbi:MAG: outer membrane lipoprotein-sorting protein [Candidatus Rifleibacteriota bacterium]
MKLNYYIFTIALILCFSAAYVTAKTASPALEIKASASTNIASEARIQVSASDSAEIDTKISNNDLLKKVDRALNPESFVSYKKIINIDTDNTRKEFVMYVGKLGRDKVLGAFLAPKSEVGRATLRIGDNMWLYIPNVRKPVRITSLQSVTGGLFNNSDIMSLDYSYEYDCVNVDEEDNFYILELKAKNNSVAYDKVTIKADKERFLPKFIKCFTASGMLVKTLEFKKIVEFENGFSRPSVTETTSPLHKGAKSIMIFSQLKRKNLDKELFNINSMHKYKDLR